MRWAKESVAFCTSAAFNSSHVTLYQHPLGVLIDVCELFDSIRLSNSMFSRLLPVLLGLFLVSFYSLFLFMAQCGSLRL